MERNTVQRQLTYEMVHKLGHSTVNEIYQSVKEVYPNVSLSTIYRNLVSLEECGEVRRIPNKKLNDIYEVSHQFNHDHFICLKCGNVIDVEKKGGQASYMDEHGNFVKEQTVVYYGTCADCLKNK